MADIEKSFSIPFEIFSILTHELKLATLLELQTVYDTSDMYDLLEMMDVHDTMVVIANKKSELEREKQRNR